VSQGGLTTNGYSISGGMKGQKEKVILNHDISGIRGILEGNEIKEDDIFQNFSENQSYAYANCKRSTHPSSR
jgi:hypothetical protein